MDTKKENAYLTLLANDSYIYCVIALYASWLKTSSRYPFYCACTDGVSEMTRKYLSEIGIKIIDLKPLEGLDALKSKLKASGYDSWIPALSKLAIYGLSQFRKFIFLDADTYIYKNLDHLFDRSHMTAVADGEGRNTPDHKFIPGDDYYRKFNAGMVVVEPSEGLLKTILDLTKSLKADRPWADQNIVAELYPDWVNDTSKHLPVYYNCFGRHICDYEKHDANFDPKNIAVLHLVGPKMSPTFGFDMYFKTGKHSTFCGLIGDICDNTNEFIIEKQSQGLLEGLALVKTPERYDLVVPYVDSTDPAWVEEFNKYNPNPGEEIEGINAPNRFRGQGGFFRFFFRGIDRFMPWIQKIHLIVQSESQVPSWINRKTVHIVRHDEFIPKEYLPTFNSTAIEMFLWNIPGLSGKFIYSNDDMFVTKPLAIDRFFVDGKPNVNFLRFSVEESRCTVYGHHIINGCRLMGIDADKRIEPHHTMRAYDKNMMKRCFKEHEEEILASISRFRSESNFNVYIYDYYQYVKGETHKINVPISDACRISKNAMADVSPKFREHRFDVICIQDTNAKDVYTYGDPYLKGWFGKLLPDVCKYETVGASDIDPERLRRINKLAELVPGKAGEDLRLELLGKALI